MFTLFVSQGHYKEGISATVMILYITNKQQGFSCIQSRIVAAYINTVLDKSQPQY